MALLYGRLLTIMCSTCCVLMINNDKLFSDQSLITMQFFAFLQMQFYQMTSLPPPFFLYGTWIEVHALIQVSKYKYFIFIIFKPLYCCKINLKCECISQEILWFFCGPCALFLCCRISSFNHIFIIVQYCAMNHILRYRTYRTWDTYDLDLRMQ